APADSQAAGQSSDDELGQWLRDYRVEVSSRGLALGPRAGVGIDRLTGQATITPALIQASGMTMESGPARLSGSAAYDRQGKILDLFNLRGVAAQLPAEWMRAAPGDAAGLIASLHPEGTVVLDVPRLHVDLAGQGVAWNSNGRLLIDHMRLGGAI